MVSPRSKARLRHALPVLAALLLVGTAGWLFAEHKGIRNCRSAQASLLRQHAYRHVPERAEYAARRYCEMNGNAVTGPAARGDGNLTPAVSLPATAGPN